ncbi:MAG: hypothetical protein WD691_09130 [Acidimicrobiales bacterium]
MTAHPHVTVALAHEPERLAPWLIAAVLAALANLAAVSLGSEIGQAEQASLVVILAATLASAGLLATRSRREQILSDQDERARPVPDELAAMAGPDRAGGAYGDPGYLGGMQRWTTALVELLDHAAAETENADRARELLEAAEDTRAMHDLLMSKDADALSLRESAMLHSIAALWETSQERLELIAAEVDLRWYRRWQARTTVERLLRHGLPSPPFVLPYG